MQVHESDFLAAYKGQMNNVRREIDSLKAQLTEKEFKIKRDQKVSELSSQVGWFKSEALSLKNDLNDKQEKTALYKESNYILGEEKWALEQALGRQQKKVKAVSEALAKSQQSNQDMLKIIKDQQDELNRLKKKELKREIFAVCEDKVISEVGEPPNEGADFFVTSPQNMDLQNEESTKVIQEESV